MTSRDTVFDTDFETPPPFYVSKKLVLDKEKQIL